MYFPLLFPAILLHLFIAVYINTMKVLAHIQGEVPPLQLELWLHCCILTDGGHCIVDETSVFKPLEIFAILVCEPIPWGPRWFICTKLVAQTTHFTGRANLGGFTWNCSRPGWWDIFKIHCITTSCCFIFIHWWTQDAHDIGRNWSVPRKWDYSILLASSHNSCTPGAGVASQKF